MPRFGWTRLAYLLFVLTVLAVLARPGAPGAETKPLATDLPQRTSPTVARPSEVTKPTETPDMTRRIEREISSLVDLGGAQDAPDPHDHPATRPPNPEAAPAEFPDREADPPIFYRPAAAGHPSVGAQASGSRPVCGDLGRFPESSRVVFPLEERYFYSYEDTWGAPRTQGGHEGTDLMAPAGAPEYAVTDGTVVPVAGSNENGWNTLGGYAVMVRADYSVGPVKAGDLFYYAHLGRPSPLKIGARVRAGQVVGYSGDTGQGPEVTRGLFPAHLHLGWYDATGSRGEADSGAMNPYPLLEWIKANGGAVTGGSDARYCEAPSPPTPVPSTGQADWPAPESPGIRPDLDTGSSNPSPVVQSEIRVATRTPVERGAPAGHRDRAPQQRVSEDHAPQQRATREVERVAQEGPRDAIVNTERPEIPEPPAPEPADLGLPEPQRPEIPSSSGATPSRGRPSPNAAEETEPEVPPAMPDLQELLERLIADLNPENEDEPARADGGPDKKDREKDQSQKPGKKPARRDREEKPADKDPQDPHAPSKPQVEPAPEEKTSPEENPPPPEPEIAAPEETEEPEPETTEPEAEEPEIEEPETTQPLPETTAAPETTSG